MRKLLLLFVALLVCLAGCRNSYYWNCTRPNRMVWFVWDSHSPASVAEHDLATTWYHFEDCCTFVSWDIRKHDGVFPTYPVSFLPVYIVTADGEAKVLKRYRHAGDAAWYLESVCD